VHTQDEHRKCGKSAYQLLLLQGITN
jgi:hypothetical protein